MYVRLELGQVTVQYLDNSNKDFMRKVIDCRTICLLVSLENTKTFE